MKVVFRSNESLSTSQNGCVISNLGSAFRQCIRARSHATSKASFHRYTPSFLARRHSQSVNTEPAARPPPALAVAPLCAFIPRTNAYFSPRQLTLPLRPSRPPFPTRSSDRRPRRIRAEQPDAVMPWSRRGHGHRPLHPRPRPRPRFRP